MKRYKSKEYEKDCRICGDFNDAPLKIARAITNRLLEREAAHTHQGFEFYIFLKGKAELEIEDKVIPGEKGDVILVEAGEHHRVLNILEKVDYITIKNS